MNVCYDPLSLPDERGYFGSYGGQFVPETLVPALEELANAYETARNDASFKQELSDLLSSYAGRPTPLYFAEHLSDYLGGARIFLKREDCMHTGSHKINNCLGQVLLAKRMGKRRIIAETGAGQHGIATASVCARFGLECVIYMGAKDMERQALNVYRMRLCGAEVRGVEAGQKTLKDAVNEAMRDWVTHIETTHYVLGSALGSHPYPQMVRDFHRVIGQETREQILAQLGSLPNELIACVGGGSNAIGFFFDFLKDENIRLTGVEAGGSGITPHQHAARFAGGRVGVLQGAKTFILQDVEGQIDPTHSISAGLDYAAIGPEHAFYRERGRIEYTYATDPEALEAFQLLSEKEGIIPALESSHGIAYAMKRARETDAGYTIIANLSGRGDKDVQQVERMINAL